MKQPKGRKPTSQRQKAGSGRRQKCYLPPIRSKILDHNNKPPNPWHKPLGSGLEPSEKHQHKGQAGKILKIKISYISNGLIGRNHKPYTSFGMGFWAGRIKVGRREALDRGSDEPPSANPDSIRDEFKPGPCSRCGVRKAARRTLHHYDLTLTPGFWKSPENRDFPGTRQDVPLHI